MAAEVVIDAPPLSLPPYGLLQSASVIPEPMGDGHWINGVRIAPESGQAPLRFDPCGYVIAGDTNRNRSLVAGFAPFGVEAYDQCSTWGYLRADYEGRARRSLAARETIGIENELDDGLSIGRSVTDAATTSGSANITSATASFTSADVGLRVSGAGIPSNTTISSVTNGTTAVLSANATASATGVSLRFGTINPHFQDPSNTVTVTSGSAVGLRVALQTAVQACADHKLGAGMIHARPAVVAGWSALNCIQQKNGKLYTPGGQQVVQGYGYSGNSPSGAAPSATSEFVYVTEPLQILQGEVEVFVPGLDASGIDRTSNTVESRAQRINAIVSNNLGIYAVQVNPSTL